MLLIREKGPYLTDDSIIGNINSSFKCLKKFSASSSKSMWSEDILIDEHTLSESQRYITWKDHMQHLQLIVHLMAQHQLFS